MENNIEHFVRQTYYVSSINGAIEKKFLWAVVHVQTPLFIGWRDNPMIQSKVPSFDDFTLSLSFVCFHSWRLTCKHCNEKLKMETMNRFLQWNWFICKCQNAEGFGNQLDDYYVIRLIESK